MPEFRRPHHRAVARLLAAFDARFLERAGCYFGGGTQIALSLDEFRESRDIDFLCCSRGGFKLLRETVSESSLGALLKAPVPLAREVRADRDGIRSFLGAGEERIKFEIVFEARIELRGGLDRALGVPVLDLPCTFAEKFLANADRGLDESTKSRDLIDLAFLAAAHGPQALEPGYRLAETAYGKAIARYLGLVLAKFTARPRYATDCARSLGIEDTATLRKGEPASRLRRPRQRRQKSGQTMSRAALTFAGDIWTENGEDFRSCSPDRGGWHGVPGGYADRAPRSPFHHRAAALARRAALLRQPHARRRGRAEGEPLPDPQLGAVYDVKSGAKGAPNRGQSPISNRRL